MEDKQFPTKENPQVVRKHVCFNCKQHPVHYVDTSWGEECSSDCSKENPCEYCQEDRDMPYVVEHKNQFCPFGVIAHAPSRKEAIELWAKSNKPKKSL